MRRPGAVSDRQQDAALEVAHRPLADLGFPVRVDLLRGPERFRGGVCRTVAGAALHRADNSRARTCYPAQFDEFTDEDVGAGASLQRARYLGRDHLLDEGSGPGAHVGLGQDRPALGVERLQLGAEYVIECGLGLVPLCLRRGSCELRLVEPLGEHAERGAVRRQQTLRQPHQARDASVLCRQVEDRLARIALASRPAAQVQLGAPVTGSLGP
jgi:hypothetical protein